MSFCAPAATAAGTPSHSAGPGSKPAGARFTQADKITFDGITFDDVLLLPDRSGVMPADADTSTRLTRSIALNIPLISGATVVRATGRDADRVPGTVFELTAAELARADDYETDDYARVRVRLASGTRAWVYAEAPSA